MMIRALTLAGVLLASPVTAAQILDLEDEGAAKCTSDGEYCLTLGATYVGIVQGSTGERTEIPALPTAEGQSAELPGWLIELSPGHILAGIRIVTNTDITGGRFIRKDLLLWDVTLSNGGVVGPVLDFPAQTLVEIDNDCRNWPAERLRPCKATFNYGGTIILQEAETGGYPALTFRTTAGMTPVAASREFGWLDTGMTSSTDMGLDMECSFQRVLNYNPLAGTYQIDQSLPECAQYFEPELLPKRSTAWTEEVWMRDATDDEIRAYHPTPDTLIADRQRNPARRVEMGWLYNEMFAGSDVIVLRISDNARCVGGECDLMLFGVNNCVEPAQCTPKWTQIIQGNRLYTVHKPAAPLDISCPDSAVMIPAGSDRGQYCITNRGLSRAGDIPASVSDAYPTE